MPVRLKEGYEPSSLSLAESLFLDRPHADR
jgi:hypothetical protein